MSDIKIKNQKSKIKNLKGVSLLFIVLITGVILAVGLGLSAILIQQMKMMGEIGYSVIAFYAADSGMEKILYLDEKTCRQNCATSTAPAYCATTPQECVGLIVGASTTSPLDGASFDAVYLSPSTFKSVGKYQEIRRAIEVTR